MDNKVLIITSGSFPFGTARAIRLRAFAKMFQLIGYKVCVYSDDISGEYVGQNEAEYQELRLYSLGKKKIKIEKLSIPLEFLTRIKEIIKTESPKLIFSTCLYDRFPLIMHVHKRFSIPIVIDSNEWYDPSTFPGGRFSWHYISHSICWKFFYPRVNGVVAISRLLEKHYLPLVEHVIRIPTIVPEIQSNYASSIDNDGSIKLLFAGSLARTKDSIKPYFEALNFFEHSDIVQFEVCGVSQEEFKQHIGDALFYKYEKQVAIHGKVAQERIIEMYQKSDYGIFFRPDQRSSHAGFSTKLGEGMSAGTPFIINDTSDVSLYIHNGENGFIVHDEKDISDVYRKIINMSEEQKKEMRNAARNTASTVFFYATYVEEFKEFINCVVGE